MTCRKVVYKDSDTENRRRYLWDQARQLVYKNAIETEDQLWECNENEFITISSTAGMFVKVRQLVRRLEVCILAEGRDFEHLL